MADIFISYASKDRIRIAPLVRELETAGYTVWWDRHLKGGTRFSAEIETELTGAAVVIVVWSPNAITSRWVADEADLALELGNLLPISFDGARSPMGFRQFQTIDFSRWTGGESPCFIALIEALEYHLTSGKRKPHQAVVLPETAQTKSDASIAVLPFVNMSSDAEQAYFSDGISEEMLNLLAKIRELTVIARTSSFTFKGSGKSIAEIGAILGVAYILEGSVRKAGDRVRITAQLIETQHSSHLWSGTFDRTLEDIFAVQDEISATIVGELRGHILGGEAIKAPRVKRSANVEAYEHYMLGQQYLYRRNRSDIETGKAHFEKALTQDPEYAPALIGLADAELLLSNFPTCWGSTPVPEALARGLPLLTRAIALDPSAAESYGVMSLARYIDGDYVAAIENAEHAIALNPNYSRGYHRLAQDLALSGDPAAATLTTRKRALERDPTSLLSLNALFAEHMNRLNIDQASTYLRKMEVVNPSAELLQFQNGIFEMMQGHLSKALELLLDPKMALQSGLFTFNTQLIVTALGYGRQLENADPGAALEFYAAANLVEDARRVGPGFEARGAATRDYETALPLAYWKAREGEYESALALLAPFGESDSGKWGRQFDLELDCSGAVLSFALHRKLNHETSAARLLKKLKQVYRAISNDPDGSHHITDYLGAVVAIGEGDRKAALNFLEKQIARTFFNATPILNNQIFDELQSEPSYRKILGDVEAHSARQRVTAEEAGLLPISKELLARLA